MELNAQQIEEILPHRWTALRNVSREKKRPVSNASVSMSRISAAIFPATP